VLFPLRITVPLATGDSGPEIAPEKFATSRVKVAAAPLSMTAPPPDSSVKSVLFPAKSRVATAATVTDESSRKKPNELSAPLSVPA
jgi:hypothetical protein